MYINDNLNYFCIIELHSKIIIHKFIMGLCISIVLLILQILKILIKLCMCINYNSIYYLKNIYKGCDDTFE